MVKMFSVHKYSQSNGCCIAILYKDGNIWWYDHFQEDQDMPYWITDSILMPGNGGNDPCNNEAR